VGAGPLTVVGLCPVPGVGVGGGTGADVGGF
jgi:hypothetical protein